MFHPNEISLKINCEEQWDGVNNPHGSKQTINK